MPEMARLTLILLVVCLLSAAALSQSYVLTAPRIAANRQATEAAARLDVLPGATKIQDGVALRIPVEGGDVDVYRGLDDGGTTVGYAFKVSQKGFSGDIDVMIGARVLPTGGLVVAGTRVLRHSETPGLGAEMTTKAYADIEALGESKAIPEFQKKFIDKAPAELRLKKDSATGTIDALTAATISSRAFTNAVRNGLERLASRLSGGAK